MATAVPQAPLAPTVEANTAAITDLFAVVQSLRADLEEAHAQILATPPPKADLPKIRDPDLFNGTGGSIAIRAFLTQLKLVFTMQPSRYAKDTTKIAYAASHLRGNAFHWIEPYLTATEAQMAADPDFTWMRTYDGFAKQFDATFGDQDQLKQAGLKIQELRQTSTVSAYASEFRRLAFILGWKDSQLIQMYEHGLSPRIRDYLVPMPDFTSFSELVKVTTNIDNKLNLQHGYPSAFISQLPPPDTTTFDTYAPQHPVAYAPAFPAPPAPYFNEGDLRPMEVDAIRHRRPIPSAPVHQVSHHRAPLTNQERQHRRDNNLCMYCGKPGHIWATCRLRPAEPAQPQKPIQAAALRFSITSPNTTSPNA